MRSGAVPQSIRFRPSSAIRIAPGQTVRIKVIKHLIGSKWAVSIGGRVFSAQSSIPLSRGLTLNATAELAGRQIILHLADSDSDSTQLSSESGLSAIRRAVTQALMRHGRVLDPSIMKAMIRRIARSGVSVRKSARALAVASAKGIDSDSPGLDDLLPLLMSEEYPGGQHRRGDQDTDGDDEEDIAQELRVALTAEDDGSALSLFNSLGNEPMRWIVIPFVYDTLHGSVRLLFDIEVGRARRIVLDVRDTEAADSRWAFSIEGGRLRAFADSGSLNRKTAREFRALRRKLQNRGLKSDDNISEIGGFDGYSFQEEEELRGIDAFR